MYGTVMIGRLADGASADDLANAADAWRAARSEVGFVDEWAMATDDGRVVVAVRFESRDAYEALADDPAQDEWWTTTLRPLLAEDPEWIDGSWSYDSAGPAGATERRRGRRAGPACGAGQGAACRGRGAGVLACRRNA